MLPLRYALRNLWRRRTRTALTLVGVAMIAFLVILTTGFATGIDASVAGSARADVVIVVGSTGETDLTRSFIALGNARQIAAAAPAVLEIDGRRAASIELHTTTRVGDRIGLLRGVEREAYLVRPSVVIVEGVEPRGPFEIAVGALASARMGLPEEELAVGRSLTLEKRPWRIVGRFAAPGTVLEAEVWGRLEDVLFATRREDVSCVALRLTDPEQYARVHMYVTQNVRFEATVAREAYIYGKLRKSLAPMAALAWIMAALVLVGGVFACANTMFAAVLARTREMGALRAVGYGPLAVGVSLLEESMLLAAIGGALGVAGASLIGEVALRLPSGAFRLDLGGAVRLVGLGAALVAGFVGGLVPAIRALRLPLTDALGGKL